MQIYLVGGAVRDQLLGLPVKERDWVVIGATVSDMLKLGFRQVGKEFPVFLHPQTNEEYALARMERKVKPGYTGFTFDTSPSVMLEDDLQRRDLTINAMAQTPEGILIDPYHGKEDLKHKILRHVSPAFAEDPVRILRVGRFLARYAHRGFHVAPETLELMRKMVTIGEIDALVAERVFKELERALAEKNPEFFFAVLAQCGALPILFPHLSPDGKGMAALKKAVLLTADPAIRFAALLHELPEQSIKAVCDRYRVPTAYAELARLTARHHPQAIKAQRLSAEELLNLLAALDVFRREERFKNFLLACQAITHFINPQWLMECAKAAKAVDVQALIAQGFTNNALAEKLKEKRREKIGEWLDNH